MDFDDSQLAEMQKLALSNGVLERDPDDPGSALLSEKLTDLMFARMREGNGACHSLSFAIGEHVPGRSPHERGLMLVYVIELFRSMMPELHKIMIEEMKGFKKQIIEQAGGIEEYRKLGTFEGSLKRVREEREMA